MSILTSTPYPRDDGEIEGNYRHSAARMRQSYAHPLQKLFEDTRSMLLHDKRKSTLDPLALESIDRNRIRPALPATSAGDFLGAMESLHSQFGLTLQTMTDRTQIFEVINEWMADIEIALQHQKNNETDLSDANFKKLQVLLRKEYETWDLIKELYFERLNDDGTSTNADVPFNQIIHDKFCINEEPFIRSIIDSNPALREMYIIMNWLENSFQKNGPPDLNEKFFIWEHTWENLKKDKLINKRTKSMVSQVDPDAPSRENKQLHPLDDEENSKVLKGAYYYLRSGNMDSAINYLIKSGERIKAAAISGHQLTAKTRFDLESGDDVGNKRHTVLTSLEYLPKSNRQARPHPDFDIRGNLKRDLWKQMSWKVCEKNNLSKFDRALLGAACGHRQAVLDVAQNWEDRLWAYLKSSTDTVQEGFLRNLSKPNNRKQLPEGYWDQRLSVAECIEKVDALTISKSEPAHSIENFFQLLQKCVMTDQLHAFIEQLDGDMPEILEIYEHSVLNGHLNRFISHLLLFFGIVDLPYSQRHIDVFIEKYVEILVDIHRLPMIPFYVQKLTDEKKISTIIRHINANERLTYEEIIDFLRISHANDLDILAIGIAVVDKMRDEDEDFSVENLYWISCCHSILENSSDVMYELLKYTIWISRKYLTLGRIEKVQKLIDQLTLENVREVVEYHEVLENTLVREYLCYKKYLEAEDALSLWKKAMSQKPSIDESILPIAATVADRTVFEKRKKEMEALELKWRRAVDYHLNTAIDKFIDILKFPLGWLRECYNLSDEDETIHVGAVRRIIMRKVVHILLKLVQDKNDNRIVRDFVYVLCDDQRNILTELSPQEIGNIFKVAENFTRQKVENIMFLPK